MSPYIGRPIGVAGHTTQKLDDPASISNDAFTMKVATVAISPDAASLQIYVDGVRQEAGVAYTVSGSTITFTGTFTSSNDFQGYVMGDAMYIQTNSVDSDHYVDGSIDNAHLADDAVDSDELAAGAVDLAHMSVNSIDSDQYVDGSIDTAHIAADAITAAKIADDVINSEHYAAASIDNEHLADNAADTAEIADNAITLAKMAGGTDGNIISYDASGDPVAIATGSDGQVLTSTGAGSPPAFEAVTAAPVTALNNATANELVTVGSTTTELDAESSLLFNPSNGSTGNFAGGATLDIKSSGSTANNQWIRHTVDVNGDYLIQCIDDDFDDAASILYTERTDSTVNYTNIYGKLALPSGDLDMVDDKGIIFGSGDDYWFGAGAGEGTLRMYVGGTQGAGTNEGQLGFAAGDSAVSYLFVAGGNEADAKLYLNCDQGGDADDNWVFESSASPNGQFFLDNLENTSHENFLYYSGGSASADSTWDDNQWDYAEFFEWKIYLDSDGAVRDLFGMTVVLDGDKVRVAESGEEDKILGVVRPKGSTGAHGDGLKWRGKYIQNVWGEFEEEGYTMVNWQEFLPNGNVDYCHAYHKDEIPEYRLEEGIGRNKDHYTKEENFYLDKNGEKMPVVVPSTEEEKAAANYTERTTHKTTGKTLSRRKYADDYDPSIPYVRREDRPREWVLIGLLGQVPVRTSAVIPDHWVKQKNLESGIDFYYIFNK